MSNRRSWVALGASLAIHVAVVAGLTMGLMQPHRVVNRVEIDLEGAAVPDAPPGVLAPSPMAGPEMPTAVSVPSTVAVPQRMAMPPSSMQAPAASSYDPDGTLQAPAAVGVPGATGVALSLPGGGGGGPGAGSGPGVRGSGGGTRGSGSGSALSGYLHTVRAKVDAAKRYPQMAQQRRQEGVVVVAFYLTVDGHVIGEPSVLKSSGYRQLDQAALRAVHRGAPYPRYPLEPQDRIPFEIPVNFVLR